MGQAYIDAHSVMDTERTISSDIGLSRTALRPKQKAAFGEGGRKGGATRRGARLCVLAAGGNAEHACVYFFL